MFRLQADFSRFLVRLFVAVRERTRSDTSMDYLPLFAADCALKAQFLRLITHALSPVPGATANASGTAGGDSHAGNDGPGDALGSSDGAGRSPMAAATAAVLADSDDEDGGASRGSTASPGTSAAATAAAAAAAAATTESRFPPKHAELFLTSIPAATFTELANDDKFLRRFLYYTHPFLRHASRQIQAVARDIWSVLLSSHEREVVRLLDPDVRASRLRATTKGGVERVGNLNARPFSGCFFEGGGGDLQSPLFTHNHAHTRAHAHTRRRHGRSPRWQR